MSFFRRLKARARVAQPVGARELTDAEALALAAGTTEVKATELLRDLGGLRGLYHAGRGEIAAKLGPGAAARLLGSRDLCQRLEVAITAERENLSDPQRVCRWARHHLAREDHESLWILALDGRNHLISSRRIAEGGIHGLHVSPRDILRAAVREAASAFILLHNHPSGDPTPSKEDLDFTRVIEEGAKTLGTPLLDHIVVSRNGCRSIL